MEYSIIRLTDRPELKAQAAAWFHTKWGIPERAYLDSMDDALRGEGPVPQWYLAIEGTRILGGMGGTNKALAPSCKGARLLEGKVFRSSTNADTLREWVKTLK